MPVFYWRHGHDEYTAPTYAHDNRLTSTGFKKAMAFARKAIEKYGPPDIIYYSPLQRAYATVKGMARQISTPLEIKPRNDLSRYFCRREKENPDIAPRTYKHDIPITESWSEFRKRCRNFFREMEVYYTASTNVWVITHALVIKEVARYHHRKLPEHIPFLYLMKIDRARRRRRRKQKRRCTCRACRRQARHH